MLTPRQKLVKDKKESEEKKRNKKPAKSSEDIEDESADEELEKEGDADEAEDADDESDDKEEDDDDGVSAPLSKLQIAPQKNKQQPIAKEKELVHDKKIAKLSKKAEDDADSDNDRETEAKASAEMKKREPNDSENDESKSESGSNNSEEEKEKKEEKKPTQKKYKKRLFVGEGNFSFTEAMLKKHVEDHPDLAKAITATEFLSEENLRSLLKKEFIDRIEQLRKQGVNVQFDIDARELDKKQGELEPKRYKRIHFNCPQLGTGTGSSDFKKQEIPTMLKAFFASAAKIQKLGDHIHMVLPKPQDPERRQFRQAYIYGIFEASAKAGYVLIAKHKFIDGQNKRYSLYQHMITGRSSSATVTDNSREYIFEKTDMSYKQICDHPEYKAGGACQYGKSYDNFKLYSCLKEPKTDDDSSSYVESDTDNLSDDQMRKVKQPEVKKKLGKGPAFFQAPSAASSSNSSAGTGKSMSSGAHVATESKTPHRHH